MAVTMQALPLNHQLTPQEGVDLARYFVGVDRLRRFFLPLVAGTVSLVAGSATGGALCRSTVGGACCVTKRGGGALRFSLTVAGCITVIALAFICTAAVVAGSGCTAGRIGAESRAPEAATRSVAVSVANGVATADAAAKLAGIVQVAMFALGASAGAVTGVRQSAKESGAGDGSSLVGSTLTASAG